MGLIINYFSNKFITLCIVIIVEILDLNILTLTLILVFLHVLINTFKIAHARALENMTP